MRRYKYYYRDVKDYPPKQTGWTNWKFHTTLYAGLFILTLAFLGLKNTTITPYADKPVKAYSGDEFISKLISPLPKKTYTRADKAQPTEDWGDFVKAVERIAPIYDFPVKVAVAQAAHESDYGTSELARIKNNYYGLNAVDWDPFNSAWSFDNPEQCIISYMQLIKSNYPDAYAVRDNPDLMIRMIREGGYASDPLYVQKVKALPEWQKY